LPINVPWLWSMRGTPVWIAFQREGDPNPQHPFRVEPWARVWECEGRRSGSPYLCCARIPRKTLSKSKRTKAGWDIRYLTQLPGFSCVYRGRRTGWPWRWQSEANRDAGSAGRDRTLLAFLHFLGGHSRRCRCHLALARCLPSANRPRPPALKRGSSRPSLAPTTRGGHPEREPEGAVRHNPCAACQPCPKPVGPALRPGSCQFATRSSIVIQSFSRSERTAVPERLAFR
jgi:hypothetical protein